MYDSREEYSANDYLHMLIYGTEVIINGESFELFEITLMIDIELMQEACELSVSSDSTAVRKLYLDTILGIMK